MLEPYEGDRPYIFINYAHADRDAVLPIIRALVDEGFRVWWDNGIEPTVDYSEYLADHVYRCACLVMFISTSSIWSDWCTREVRFAFDLKKKVLPIYLEDVELPGGLRMLMGGKQALYWYEYASGEAVYQRLLNTRMLEPCLTEKGRRSRGVRSRGTGKEMGRVRVPQPESAQTESKVAPKVVPEERATPKDEPKDAPEAESKVEPKADTKSAAKAESTTESVQDTSTDQLGVARSPHAARQEIVGDTSDSREEKRVNVVVADESGSVPGVARKGKLVDYSWPELKELSRSIAAAGSDAEGLAIARAYHLVGRYRKLRGDEKPLELKDGTRTCVRILGFRHDELAGGGRAGISFEFIDVPATHHMNANWMSVGGWQGSEMRHWLNTSFLSQLPDDLLASIETVRKRTNNAGVVLRENYASAVTSTDNKLWLLSQNEVYGSNMGVYGYEGSQYQLYTDQDVSIAYYGFCSKSAVSWWWLRSPHANFSYSFLVVDNDGGCHGEDAYCSYGVSPGFCI